MSAVIRSHYSNFALVSPSERQRLFAHLDAAEGNRISQLLGNRSQRVSAEPVALLNAASVFEPQLRLPPLKASQRALQLLGALVGALLLALIMLPLVLPADGWVAASLSRLEIHLAAEVAAPAAAIPTSPVAAAEIAAALPTTHLSEPDPATQPAAPQPLQLREALLHEAMLHAARQAATANFEVIAENQGSYRAPQGTVFDSGKLQQLRAIAPARLEVGAESVAMADVAGEQRVVIGEHCFSVRKLDYQALRGMAAWTRCDKPSPDPFKWRLPSRE